MRLHRLPAGACLALALFAPVAQGARPSGEEAAFQKRARFIIEKRAAEDPAEIVQWADRVGVTDPHKYALGPILARLALNPADPKALAGYRMLMVVDKGKGDRGLYHFAAYYRTRLYFQFRDHLPQDIIGSNRYDVANFFHVLCRGGTENHAFMHRTSGYLWTEEIPGLSTGGDDPRDGRWLREFLRGQVRKFYTAGMGEYDSSTYVVFTVASWSNIYDFSKDEKMRDLARAAIDWLAATTALKYFHGCHLGPESRGFSGSAVRGNTEWLSWLWWDDSARPIRLDEDPKTVAKHATVCLALSKYRPHPVIRNIATKNVALPFEARGSKPQYYGHGDNKDQEYLYFNREYAMGTLYSPEKGIRTTGTILPQTTMFKAALLDRDDVRTFGAANGYHRHFPIEGRTPYDQYHQKRDAAINICFVDREEGERTQHQSILGVPAGIPGPVTKAGWFFWQVGKAYLAARPLNGKVRESGLRAEGENQTHGWLVSPGRLTGWVIQLGQRPDYSNLRAFQRAVLNRCKLDLSRFESHRTVEFRSLRGDVLKMRHTGGPGGRPEAWTNGEPLEFRDWPVYESPYVKEDVRSGILRLSDGRRTLTIDCSGEWPTFTEGEASD